MENLDVEMAEQMVKLKEENEQLKADIKLDNAFWKQECDSLQKELAIREKAIDIICEILEENDKAYKSKSKCKTKELHKKYFIEQAKESLK